MKKPIPPFVALILAVAAPLTHGGELGTYALHVGPPEGIVDPGTTYHSGGSQTAAGLGWKSYGIANFGSLSVGGDATTLGNQGFGQRHAGGGAYWEEEFTISSPSVPDGTTGILDFTLFFEGVIAASAAPPVFFREFRSSIGYRWETKYVDDPNANTGQSGSENRTIYVAYGYFDAQGPEFLNSPRHHSMFFEFGEPLKFRLAVTCSTRPYTDDTHHGRVEVRSSGWNGFQNIRLGNGTPVADAVVTSPGNVDFSSPSTSAYADWASLFLLDGTSANEDANNNGISNFMEYALGRNPLDSNSSPSLIQPALMTIGEQQYPCFTFTRPRLGGKPGDVAYLPKRSPNLSNWSGSGFETTVEPNAGNSETVTVRSTTPAGQGAEFMRLEVAPLQN